MIPFHKGKALSVPWDTGKYYDTYFGLNKFSKKKPIIFSKYYVVKESFTSTKCVLIQFLRYNLCRTIEMNN